MVGKRLYGIGSEDKFFQILERFATTTSTKENDAYKGIVAACIDVGAQQMALYKPRLYKSVGKERKFIEQHQLIELLSNPQPDNQSGLTQEQLFSVTYAFKKLYGEWFWYIVNGQRSNKPRAIYILQPSKMTVDINDNGEVCGYTLRKNDGTKIPFKVNEILHYAEFNPNNPYRGMGLIEKAQEYISTEQATAKFTSNFFKRNAGLSGILSIKGAVSKNAFQKFARRWRQHYEGVDNAGKVAILRESDAAFTKLVLGLDELDMTALRKATIDEVLMMFRVPRALLGLSDDAGLGSRAAVEVHEYIFSKYNIEPEMRAMDSALNRLLDRFWPSDRLDVAHDDIIPSDKEFELKTREAAVDNWLSRNEIRSKDGLEPLPGGDELRAPINQVPLEGGVVEAAKQTVRPLLKIKKKSSDQDLAIKENFRLSLMRNQSVYEASYQKTVVDILQKQEKEALTNLEAKASAARKDFTEPIFDQAEAVKEFVNKLLPNLIELYGKQGALALIFAGDEDSQFEVTSQMKRLIENGTARMSQRYNKDTLQDLNDTLTEGILAGESLGKLKKRVGAVYKEAKGYRAERIARTETLKASNTATNLAYDLTGYIRAKQWFANPGACEFCRSLNGKIVKLNETFATVGQTVTGEDGGDYLLNYDDVGVPPLHPNCSCTIIPVRD